MAERRDHLRYKIIDVLHGLRCRGVVNHCSDGILCLLCGKEWDCPCVPPGPDCCCPDARYDLHVEGGCSWVPSPTCPTDNRECGWFGCHRPECEQFCAGLPDDCAHDWTLRPESDTHVCEICGAER